MEGSGRSEAAWGLPRNEVTMSTPQHASGPWSELYPPPGVPLKTGSVRVTLDPGQTPGSSTASGVPPATSKGGTLEWVRPQRPVIHPEVGRRLGVCGDTRQWRGREPAMLPPRPLGVRGPFKSGRCFGLGAGKTARGAAGRKRKWGGARTAEAVGGGARGDRGLRGKWQRLGLRLAGPALAAVPVVGARPAGRPTAAGVCQRSLWLTAGPRAWDAGRAGSGPGHAVPDPGRCPALTLPSPTGPPAGRLGSCLIIQDVWEQK